MPRMLCQGKPGNECSPIRSEPYRRLAESPHGREGVVAVEPASPAYAEQLGGLARGLFVSRVVAPMVTEMERRGDVSQINAEFVTLVGRSTRLRDDRIIGEERYVIERCRSSPATPGSFVHVSSTVGATFPCRCR
jgi:hypothetical protein